ncbi:MAG: PBP1A family penicillin-binding protein [Nitrospiraceae bacterium]|nr:PBP1A family penicillin-binding protein [Nitrospiraceae bacterium]
MSKQETDRRSAESTSVEELGRRRGCGGLFLVAMLVVAACWGGALGAFVWVLDDAKTTIQALEAFRPKVGSKVFSADGQLLGEFAIEQRELVNLNQIPLHVQKAFMAAEDKRFYEHRGVRLESIVSAFYLAAQGHRLRGASTITQQVVRNIEPLGVGTERRWARKIREAIIAFQVERDFTKDEILELYLNQLFLGVSANGVQAASRQYFSKDVWDLTLSEGAMLAGLTRAPNRNQPFRHPDRAVKYRNVVLKQMLDYGFISQEDFDSATAESLEESVVTPEEREVLKAEGKGVWAPNKYKAPYFVEEIRSFILNQSELGRLYDEGLEIHTTLDMRLQEAAEDALLSALDKFDADKLKSLTKAGKEDEFVPVTGALVCIDNRPGYKGYVRAMVGGRDFDKKKFNCATQAKRPPGSSVKPFVWAAAIANGLTPSTIEIDEPFERIDAWGNVWRPKNFTSEFLGPVSLRVALQKSINMVSIKLVERLTMQVVRSYLERAGIRTPIDSAVGLTIALGTPVVTVLDHCTAYSTFANLGIRYDPLMLTEIKNRDGITLASYRPDSPDDHEPVMRPNVAYVMTYLLQGVAEFGTGARSRALERPRAGKTGTTNESRDVWFCGFTPDFTCVVWIGYEDYRPLGKGRAFTGGRLACPIWTDFMVKAHEGLPVRQFEEPEGIEWYTVDRNTGLAGGSFREAFIEGTSPPVEMPPVLEEAEWGLDSRLLETL